MAKRKTPAHGVGVVGLWIGYASALGSKWANVPRFFIHRLTAWAGAAYGKNIPCMDNPLLFPCGDVMLHALQMLTLNEQQIRSLFPHREVLHFRDKERNKSLLEIVLDASTISCILDSQGRCYKVYLFLDEVEHVDAYKHYCNGCCLPIADNFWLYGGYSVELKKLPIDTFFVFSQLTPTHTAYGAAN